jgi:hypothetical protein
VNAAAAHASVHITGLSQAIGFAWDFMVGAIESGLRAPDAKVLEGGCEGGASEEKTSEEEASEEQERAYLMTKSYPLPGSKLWRTRAADCTSGPS